MGYSCKLCYVHIFATIVFMSLKSCDGIVEIQDSRKVPSFEYGHYVQPLVKRFENSSVILKDSNIIVQLKCRANFPTEWVFDDDMISGNRHNGLRRLRLEWTDRKFQTSFLDEDLDYIAWIHLHYAKVIEPDMFYCKAVDNGIRGVKVSLIPMKNDEVLIYEEVTDLKKNELGLQEKSYCPIQFYLNTNADGKFYFKCKTKGHENDNEEDGNIEFQHQCYSSAQCGNTFRNIRVPRKCITVTNNENTRNSSWKRGDLVVKEPTVIFCKASGSERGSMEVFFTGIGKTSLRKIHISKDEIESKDFLTLNFNLTRDKYYTGERIEGNCIVPKYGFSFDPVFLVKINDEEAIEERNYVENDDQYDERVWLKQFSLEKLVPGKYTIACIAPVWNTTEWANINQTVIVKETIDPWFENSVSNITLKLGDANKEVKCVPSGDPPPVVSWKFTSTPATRQDGDTLRFLKVTDYVLGSYACIATNRFGKSATQIFQINVESPVNESVNISQGLDTKTLVTLVISIIVVIILAVLAVLFIYCKFIKLGTQLVTYLTYAEVKEFTEGKQRTHSHPVDEESGDLGIDYLPYNSAYEIKSREHLVYDERSVLGSGEYGIVLNGKLKIKGKFVPVAVKTVKKNVNVSYFKALLSELKIMAYIGDHENVVNLMGAWTSNIKNRDVYVCVELCKTSLLTYLQSNKASFHNFVKSGELISEAEAFRELKHNTTYTNIDSTFSTFNLIKWSAEIAMGMEFLVSKNVIHGDLAARNILLTNNLTSKICDFGLARQLIDYNYVKSESCPLPWKWMAIESLSEMKFSHKSDVWAYGVTLWEIFSLGMTPYPGSSWTMDFADQLRQGLRMGCPFYSPTNIYMFMLDSWNEETTDRPNFTELKEFLHKLLKQTIGF